MSLLDLHPSQLDVALYKGDSFNSVFVFDKDIEGDFNAYIYDKDLGSYEALTKEVLEEDSDTKTVKFSYTETDEFLYTTWKIVAEGISTKTLIYGTFTISEARDDDYNDYDVTTEVNVVDESVELKMVGSIGPQGLSAYQLWLNEGNEGTISEFLNSLQGEDGSTPELRFTDGTGIEVLVDTTWELLVNEEDIRGPKGDDGTSVQIVGSVEDTDSDPQSTLDTAFPDATAGDGVIDETTGHLWVYDGSIWTDAGQIRGDDGREVEFSVSSTHIRWRYVGSTTWINLVTLDSITGEDGTTPTIQDGNWFIDGTDTGVQAEGIDGDTPTIQDGNWFIGGVDTGVQAEGVDGQDGNTPTIQDGNWWIGGTDTGIQAEGVDGDSAYDIAVSAGFVGTEAEWLTSLEGADGESAFVRVDGTEFQTRTGTEDAWETQFDLDSITPEFRTVVPDPVVEDPSVNTSDVTDSEITYNWNKATPPDNGTFQSKYKTEFEWTDQYDTPIVFTQADFYYEVYEGDETALSDKSTIKTQTKVAEGTDINTATVDFPSGTPVDVAVLVRDPEGNESIYNVVNETTLNPQVSDVQASPESITSDPAPAGEVSGQISWDVQASETTAAQEEVTVESQNTDVVTISNIDQQARTADYTLQEVESGNPNQTQIIVKSVFDTNIQDEVDVTVNVYELQTQHETVVNYSTA